MVDLPPLTRADLVELGRRIRIPQPIEAVAPDSGQVWRALWDETAALVVILEVNEILIRVAPFFFDFDDLVFEDEDHVALAGRPAVVLWRHARKIAPLTLDVMLGSVPLAGRQTMGPIIDQVLESQMTEPVDSLAAWTRKGEGDGTLSKRLLELRVSSRQIADALGTPLAVGANILRNVRPVTSEEAEALASTVPLTANEILSANPILPQQWQEELQSAAYRSPLRDLARKRHRSDSETWRSVAYGAYALAARQGNNRETASVRARILSYLQSELERDA
ncbi:hypothetical protein [Cryobacterium sp. TMT4-10]|uniref:hypothetical protein n=1 Tax=Cryobacterium sp. TMT4-10 TaxID=1259256 RepID=UPI00106AD1FD|nr:hypothetical protein [Cryobacterium sp. TMT4-10]TFD16821.1 hypothetical protein E3T42_08945 [Cryobacterium sp. TMT4-10]